jgi:hypothetical protein
MNTREQNFEQKKSKNENPVMGRPGFRLYACVPGTFFFSVTFSFFSGGFFPTLFFQFPAKRWPSARGDPSSHTQHAHAEPHMRLAELRAQHLRK